MTVYYMTLATVFIFGFLSRIADERKYKMLSIFWIVLIMIVIVTFSGFRSGIGDTYYYEHSFETMIQTGKPDLSGKDIGFNLFSFLLSKISSDPRILIFTTALITNVINIFVLYKYRNYMELQIFMYVATGYLTTSMNGIRQCLAASLVFLCTPLLIKRKTISYIICMILISTLHQSAFFMIGVYFLVKIRPWSKKFYRFIGVACLVIIFYDKISPLIFKIIENMSYVEYKESDSGSSFIRFFVSMIPVILSYYKRSTLSKKLPYSDILINISVICCIFTGLGMWNWIFNRLNIYLQLYNFILLPYIITQCLEVKEKRVVYFFMVIGYLLFFYMEQVKAYNLIYKSIINLKDYFYTNTLKS